MISKRGRYQSKWKEWDPTLVQMDIDEELLTTEGGLGEAFKEVDIKLIREHSFELLIK